jgi:hypothetical protein
VYRDAADGKQAEGAEDDWRKPQFPVFVHLIPPNPT